ncbi:MAG: hypothetical protein AAB817_00200 [Patescibacteria group bacterium]
MSVNWIDPPRQPREKPLLAYEFDDRPDRWIRWLVVALAVGIVTFVVLAQFQVASP